MAEQADDAGLPSQDFRAVASAVSAANAKNAGGTPATTVRRLDEISLIKIYNAVTCRLTIRKSC
jgi:hypothetical protein